jgi:LmbE family N-acetylglucosaminyl deacetylase
MLDRLLREGCLFSRIRRWSDRAWRLCGLTVLLAGFGAQTASAQVTVFAARPDDEAIIAAGVIQRAKASGKTVKVVVASNGDCASAAVGQAREQETMAAMALLGLAADDVIFLGYPDCGLRELYYYYTTPGAQFTSDAGFTGTYAYEGLGHTDYHTYIYGVPANYNGYSLIQDLRTLLQNYKPQDIYLPSAWDNDLDHYALNFLVSEAVVPMIRSDATFQPTMHDAILNEPCELCNPSYHWPMPAFTPTIRFAAPPYLNTTPLAWADVESVDVPAAMQATTMATNLKSQAISQYVSAGDSEWLQAFVKRDEIFWKWELWANLALKATATASSSITTATSPDRINDGVVVGYPVVPSVFRGGRGEWVSNNELAGAWAQLTWTTPQQITRLVLHDRPGPAENISGGTLTFSDGSSLTVGALPANGVGLTVTFPQKSITWVRFTIGGASGTAVGLSEIEAFGPLTSKLPPQTPQPNTPPSIVAGPTAGAASITDAATTSVSVSASDADGDSLTYSWTTTAGRIEGAGASVTFVPAPVSTPTTVRITVFAADGHGGIASSWVEVSVTPSNGPQNIALQATATASTESTVHGQVAAKAIDGVVGGYPTDAQREWASQDQLAGAWIQLTWTAPRTISRSVLHDRINTADQILGGMLRFSDGSSVPVGTLPDDGTGLATDFPARTVTWIRFEVTSARGVDTGLAEWEVYSAPQTGSNGAPQIASGPMATPSSITDAQTSSVAIIATDADGDPLTYSWQTSGGSITGSGATATFTPPHVTTATTFRIDVQVFDGHGGSASGFVNVSVTPSDQPRNLASIATATASSENVGRGQGAIQAIDGIVDGYPTDPTKEWVSIGQLTGAWIQLTWPSVQTLGRVVLHDRINSSDQITSGTLRFSDGSTLAVGSLPNDGTGLPIDFAARSVTWVRLEVISARGDNAGLAEFETYPAAQSGSNHAPQLTSGPTATPATITDGQTSSITLNASDLDGDTLTYSWQASGGSIGPAGSTVTFTPPHITTPTTFRIDVQVTDGHGGSVAGFVNVSVTPTNPSTNLASFATATASSENVGRGQGADKAIDGIVDGYPTDPTREWSAVGQLAGAWIQLTWPTPQTIVKAVLHDRINSSDQILVGTLRFSDGSSVPVATLPNNGLGLSVDFPGRTVSWVRFEIGTARGDNTGLAEFEIYGPSGIANTSPQITSGPTANPTSITDVQSTTISVTASDADGDPLTYTWHASGGALVGSGASIGFVPPRITAATTYRIDVTVTDGLGGSATQFVNVPVTPSSTQVNIARSATATASSENASRGQGAAKAVDGVASGYPNDPTAEWSTIGQGAGAWIQLDWATAQTVSRVVLNDRINTEDQILGATLTFSDGSSVSVGALPNDGSPLQIDFASRSVLWVRLTVTSARGSNVGLAEFEVY